jgi:hypothetical protein
MGTDNRHRHHGEIVGCGETCGDSVEVSGVVDIHMWFIVLDTLRWVVLSLNRCRRGFDLGVLTLKASLRPPSLSLHSQHSKAILSLFSANRLLSCNLPHQSIPKPICAPKSAL